MSDASRPKFTIVGGGPSGAVMANYLGMAGHEVEVYEKRLDLRSADIPAGRSINLALSVRGIHALTEIGVINEVMADAIPMRGRAIHDPEGGISFQPYGKAGQAIYSVSRGRLNGILLDAAENHPSVKLFFNQTCIDVDLDAAAARFVDGESGEESTVAGDMVIGADGAFSAVRNRMQRLDRFDYSITYLEHDYKELTIPPAADGGFRMEKNALHIWPRRSYMMIALPNADGSYTCTCFWPHAGPHSFDNLESEEAVRTYFCEHFADAVPHMPTLAEDYFTNPASSLATVRCRPWFHEDKVVLLGDAAHAVVPFYGQGMNASFEDCTILSECLKERGPDWVRALRSYYDLRKKNADAIADLAVSNFIEMRDHVGSPAFLRKKKREKLLHDWFPDRYVPLYSMVTFSRIPYAEAVRRAGRQERALKRIVATAIGLAVVLLVLIFWGLL